MERLNEIWESIRANKLRTILTGFSVAWGIFMLVILLGVGEGLKNGTSAQFADDAINSIWVRNGQSSLPYSGMLPGRSIIMNNEDYEVVKRQLNDVGYITARYQKWDGFTVKYQSESGTYNIRGVHPDHRYVEKTEMIAGRYINDMDILRHRKVCVIGDKLVSELFGGASSTGEWIYMNGVPFQIVGSFVDEGSEGENSIIYIPISTAQLTFGGGDAIDQLIFTVESESVDESRKMAENVRQYLAQAHLFDPSDPRAVHIRNNFENFKRISDVLDLMKLFFWLIGILTIVAGIVGVSNIMIITVKERTREIGIRKSLGATPYSIVAMILQESLVITALFGYFGLFSGIFLLELIARFLPDSGAVFANPSVNFNTAIAALVLLITAGTLAGLIPALRAARIKPVTALMDV